jgi:predicted dehydrogenase
MQQKYPAAEIVQHSQAIMQDDDIDLIIVSAREKNNLRLLGEILQTGKHVRII